MFDGGMLNPKKNIAQAFKHEKNIEAKVVKKIILQHFGLKKKYRAYYKTASPPPPPPHQISNGGTRTQYSAVVDKFVQMIPFHFKSVYTLGLWCVVIFPYLSASSAMAEAKVMSATTNKFSLHLHRVLRSQPAFEPANNLFYSPASVLVALGMTYLGARGDTAKQMNSSFHLNEIPDPELKQVFHKFLQSLSQSSSTGNEIAIANRLFAQMGYDILQEFQDESSQFFDAQIALVDYEKNTEGAREEVNKWVEKQTKDKIGDLIPKGMFTADTRLALVNAIYFKGSWMKKFDPNTTQPGDFQVTPSKKVSVPMMYQSDKFKYFESQNLDCQMVELPYAGEKMSMIVLLPNKVDGLSKLEESLSFEQLDTAINHLKTAWSEDVEVTLPKFKLAEKFSLKDVLSQMGATDMFNPARADFTGICGGNLYVSEVVHKAFVDVNEEGTEAAAATGIGIMLMSMPMNPIFRADHPFLFLIHHNETGAILFLGRMATPL